MSSRLKVKTGTAKLRGLGDLVAVVAAPIARVIHLDPAKCGCEKRQERLNARFPFRV
jgi:hypothetical protein